jgi:hypothetical protein
MQVVRMALVAAVVCTGCMAKAPRPARMAPDSGFVDAGSALRRAVAVGNVTGGKKTNPLVSSRVGAAEVREALTLALRARGMHADDPAGAPFRLDVAILEVTEPEGYTTRVHAVLRYALRARDGGTRFDRVVDTVGEASISEVFYGVERLRVANERAIRANLADAFEALAAAERSAPLAAR